MHFHVLLVSIAVGFVSAAIDDDLITSLPGLSYTPKFRSYSGYLKATGTKRLHYWFVESQGNPSSDPLVLWLNGGPGCSSVEGLLNEHGPYMVQEDGKTLEENPFSWNRIANVLYLEAPAGVGYSYSSDKDYKTSDDQVATDNYWALKNFLANYPEYAGNEFFVTGESYGGIYVPTLSVRILQDKKINFQGAAVGNGALSFPDLDNSIVPFAYSHGLIGSILMENLYENCCNNGQKCNYYDNPSSACNKYVMEVHQIIGQLNIYNMYEECFPSARTFPPLMFTKNPYVQALHRNITARNKNVGGAPPCIDATPITSYMNMPGVRKALHIPDGLPDWAVCSGEVGALYQRQYDNMTPQVKEILGAKKRMVVYNGDVDMACNFLGDEWFVDSLGRPVDTPRKAWQYKAEDGTSQVAGYVKQFDLINFVTVRGSGHMVPQDRPRPAFDMFERFIKNKKY